MEFLDTLFDSAWYWLIAGAILIGLEIVIPGAFLMWIGGGMLITGASILLFPDTTLVVQLLLFITAMVSCVTVGVILQRHARQNSPTTVNAGLEQYVGRHVTVVLPFEAQGAMRHDGFVKRGRIKLEDSTYAAMSKTTLEEGQLVVISGVLGGTFIVEPEIV